MTDDRWTVRGIAADLQRAAADAAKNEGRSVGRWLTDAIKAELVSHTADTRQTSDVGLREMVETLAGQVAALAERLAGVEQRQTDGRQMADTAAAVHIVNGTDAGQTVTAADTLDIPNRGTSGRQMAGTPAMPPAAADGHEPAADDFPARARAAMAAHGHTQVGLAEKAGIGKGALGHILTGYRRGTLGVRAKIAAALGIEVGG